tara:strand:+ start:303 stop:422 length:120 start_codon:yes stop_codon:yes gene_type:complete
MEEAENRLFHLVMGRQIMKAEDPVAEAYRILRKELRIAA